MDWFQDNFIWVALCVALWLVFLIAALWEDLK